jgi:hypothetical protein
MIIMVVLLGLTTILAVLSLINPSEEEVELAAEEHKLHGKMSSIRMRAAVAGWSFW